ncbi:hypothetical protein L2E82_42260 [Cichorium intybus]|uniref:Uncharacterized protein n=1 Tax=Cichorium intybus TaxID=13427 RepID=A0ACB8ZLM9_CICIN|nr:hypothetical protein L2E82_42260 [Cichorium intybus]
MTTSASTPHRAGPNRQGRESNPEVDLRATIAEEVSRALREAVPLIVEQNRDIIAKMMEERLNTNRRAEEGCYLIQVVISRLFLLWSFERFDVTANKLDNTLALEMMGSDHVLVNDGYGDCLIYIAL